MDELLPTTTTLTGRDGRWLRPELVASWVEIVLVLAVMLGPFAWSSTLFALKSPTPDFASRMMSTRSFLHLLALQGGLLAAFLLYLRFRGWRPVDLNIRIDLWGTLAAPALLVVASGANVLVAVTLKVIVACLAPHPHGLVAALSADAPRILPHSIDTSWLLIVVVSVVNAYLEELVFVGYAFQQFAARRNVLFALLCMAFLRMLLHTYKGPLEMLGIGAFSMVYGLAYWKLRRLWPLVLAHALTDLGAFSLLKLLFGR